MARLIRSAPARSRVVLPPPSPVAAVSSNRVHASGACASSFLRGSFCYIVQRGWERASYGELLGARVFPCRPGKCSCAGPAACCIFELAPLVSQANAAPSTLLLTLSGTGFASYAQYGVATAWQELVDFQVRGFSAPTLGSHVHLFHSMHDSQWHHRQSTLTWDSFKLIRGGQSVKA